jgi:hypothetical protein
MKEYFTGTDRFNRAHKLSGAMLSAYALRGRKDPLSVRRWMLDSGAFTQVTKFGDFIQTPEEYVRLAVRFQDQGDLACIATQDYMCEPSVIAELQSQGRQASVRIHQRKTVERYIQIMDEAEKQGLKVPVMPVLQGWEVDDYQDHLIMYSRMLSDLKYQRCRNLWKTPFLDKPHYYGGELLNADQWIGIGSTCKRNNNPEVVSQILDQLSECMGELAFTNSRIHLFGFKKTGLRQANIKDRIYSADSFAYDFADRMAGKKRTTKMRIKSAQRFSRSIIHNNVQTSFF